MATRKKAVKKKVAKKVIKKAPVKKTPAKKKPAPSKFYTFRQNNSFGKFDYDAKKGISVYVIVEANSIEDANTRAENIGLYFDGRGDCPCCGNRWSEQYDYSGKDDSTPVPSIYDEEVKPDETFPGPKKGEKFGPIKWTSKKQFDGFIHYKNGTIAGFWR